MKGWLFNISIFTLWTSSCWSQCHVPNSIELQTFFNNQAHWTEVQSKDSYEIATRKVLRIEIDFNHPQKSRFFKGEKLMGGIKNFCLNTEEKKLHIETKQTKIQLVKNSSGSLETSLRFLGIGFTYYYRPNHEVIGRQVSSEVFQINSTPSPP